MGSEGNTQHHYINNLKYVEGKTVWHENANLQGVHVGEFKDDGEHVELYETKCGLFLSSDRMTSPYPKIAACKNCDKANASRRQ